MSSVSSNSVTHSYSGTSVAVGICIGLTASHLINADATEQAVKKVCRASDVAYQSLTYKNVATFTWTCIGVTIATAIAVPCIKAIFREIAT